jgi:hypothetical protein
MGENICRNVFDSALAAIQPDPETKQKPIPGTMGGLRKSFSTWAYSQKKYFRDAIELQIGHVVGTPIERKYNFAAHMDERRTLLDDWATYCSTPAPVPAVVPITQPEIK